MVNIEIYKSVKNLESFERRVRESSLTAKNKEIIFSFASSLEICEEYLMNYVS